LIGGLVLAAGAGTRFGGDKQLAELDGRPLLEHALRTLAAAPVDSRVVVLGAGAEQVLARIDLHGAKAVTCERWQQGQSASFVCGLAELEACEAIIVLLGDQPRVSSEAVRRVLGARGDAPAVRASYGGLPGHPVVIERELFGRLLDVTGDHGARNLLRRVGTREVPCDDLGGGEDVDTLGQLEALRARDGVA
jgi:molybdenum cofactor cytidylyltransferase